MIDDDENNETEHSLLDIEPMSIFKSLDIRSSISNRPELPSEEFGEVTIYSNFHKRLVAMM